jgi:hypothetical protein
MGVEFIEQKLFQAQQKCKFSMEMKKIEEHPQTLRELFPFAV